MSNSVRGILEANKRYQDQPQRLTLAERYKLLKSICEFNSQPLKEFLEVLSDGELVILATMLSGSRDADVASGTLLGFLVGYHLRHEAVCD